MGDFKNIGRTINLKSPSDAKRKWPLRVIIAVRGMHCASLHKETVAEHMVGDTPVKSRAVFIKPCVLQRKAFALPSPFACFNVIPVFFSLLSVVWPRRLLMRLLGFTRVHKPDILQDQRRGFLCSGQCSDLLFFYFLFPWVWSSVFNLPSTTKKKRTSLCE